MPRTRTLLLGLLLTVAGGASATVDPRPPALHADDVSLVGQDPGVHPIRCNRATTRPAPATRSIGSGGGRISAGPHQFVLLSNALTENVDFTVTVVASDSAIVEIKPSGTRFQRPARLSVAYAALGCDGSTIGNRVELWRVDERGEVTDVVPAMHQRNAGRIVAEGINHLSRYVIASN